MDNFLDVVPFMSKICEKCFKFSDDMLSSICLCYYLHVAHDIWAWL